MVTADFDPKALLPKVVVMRIEMVILARVLTLTFLLAASCLVGSAKDDIINKSQQKKSKAMIDKHLLQRVNAAVSKQLVPKEIEEFVGYKAQLNTTRKYHREILRAERLLEDPEDSTSTVPKHPELLMAKDVVFWLRPIRYKGWYKFVGVYWSKNGKPRIFKGIRVSF